MNNLHTYVSPISENLDNSNSKILNFNNLYVNKIRFFNTESKEIKLNTLSNYIFNKNFGIKKNLNENNFYKFNEDILSYINKLGIFKNLYGEYNEKNKILDYYLNLKSRYYFSITNKISKNGQASYCFNGGFRNVLGLFENIDYNFDNSINRANSENDINFSISFPFLFKSILKFETKILKENLMDNLTENKYKTNLSFLFNNFNFEFGYNFRYNKLIDNNIIINKNYKNDCFEKKYLNFKFDYNNFNILNLIRCNLSNELCFGDINLNKFGIKMIKDNIYLNKKCYLSNILDIKYVHNFNDTNLSVNDKNKINNPRGFNKIDSKEKKFINTDKKNIKDEILIWNSTKWNIVNLNIFGKNKNLGLFNYFDYYNIISDFSLKEIINKSNFSFGYGANFEIQENLRLEILYNLYSKKLAGDEINKFQIKISFLD